MQGDIGAPTGDRDGPPSDGYAIRPVAEDDYERGFALLLATLDRIADGFEATEFRTNLKRITDVPPRDGNGLPPRPTACVFVAEQIRTGTLVATGTLLMDMGDLVPGAAPTASVRHVVVHPDFRGLGLGRRMVEHLVAEATDRGFRKVSLDTEEGTVGFYERLGFSVSGVHMSLKIKRGDAGAKPIPDVLPAFPARKPVIRGE